MAQVIIAGSIYQRLKEEAERRGAAVDEVVVELLEAALGASLDPPERAEFHRGLAEKFLRKAEELLARDDYVQASEKAWGAAAQMVKAVSRREGKRAEKPRRPLAVRVGGGGGKRRVASALACG